MVWMLGEESCRLNTALVVVPALPSPTSASLIEMAGTATVATLEATLFDSAWSGWLAKMAAVLVINPGKVGWKVRLIVAVALLVREPSVHTTVLPLFVKIPWEVEPEMKVAFGGIGLVTVTPEAAAGPWLVARMVKVIFLPTTTGSGVADTPRVTSTEPLSTQHTRSMVERLSVQPPAMFPEKLGVSSNTKSCQTPFGLVPLNTDKSATYGPGGAGGSRRSPVWKSVRW